MFVKKEHLTWLNVQPGYCQKSKIRRIGAVINAVWLTENTHSEGPVTESESIGQEASAVLDRFSSLNLNRWWCGLRQYIIQCMKTSHFRTADTQIGFWVTS